MAAKPFLTPAVEKIGPMLQAAMEKALADMSADLVARAKATNPYRGMSPLGLSVGTIKWPYGTILRPKGAPSDSRRLMVIVDRGPNVAAVMVRSATTRPVGHVEHYYAHDRWEPTEE